MGFLRKIGSRISSGAKKLGSRIGNGSRIGLRKFGNTANRVSGIAGTLGSLLEKVPGGQEYGAALQGISGLSRLAGGASKLASKGIGLAQKSQHKNKNGFQDVLSARRQTRERKYV